MVITAQTMVFNLLHDMDTEQIRRVELEAYRLKYSDNEIDKVAGSRLQLQCRYVIEQRERSGDDHNKRPWSGCVVTECMKHFGAR